MAEEGIDPKIQLYVKTETEKSRSKTLGNLGVLATILALLTGFGVYGLAIKHTDDLIKKGVLNDIETKAKESLKRTETSSTDAAKHKSEAENIVQQIDLLKSKYEKELKRLAELRFKIDSLEKSLSTVEKQAVRYDSSIHLESLNSKGEFARHYNSMMRIGGERNKRYEGDRTWIIRKK